MNMFDSISPNWITAYQLLEDPMTTELVINGYDQWFSKREGLYRREPVEFSGPDDYIGWINHLLGRTGTAERIDGRTPVIETSYVGGHVHARVHVVCPPVVREPALTIAKQSRSRLTLDDLIANDTVSGELANFLYTAVAGRLNVIISGGTGSGKTTMLQAMIAHANTDERMVVIQEVPELALAHPNVTYLETRAVRTNWRSIPADQMLGLIGEWAREIAGAGAAAAGEVNLANLLLAVGHRLESTYTGGSLSQVTISELVKASLRMRPHRIIVGEVRGGEIVDFLVGANSGHDGSMTTIHASSARDCLYKLEMLCQMRETFSPLFTRQLISASVDIIVQLSPAALGQHRVTEVLEVERTVGGDIITATPIFRWDSRNGHVQVGRLSQALKERLAEHGVLQAV